MKWQLNSLESCILSENAWKRTVYNYDTLTDVVVKWTERVVNKSFCGSVVNALLTYF